MQASQDPARMGQQQVAAEDGGGHDNQSALPGAIAQDLPGGSLQSQQTGGSGPQQGITDSHQRQMEMHSDAWGKLEQPVGNRQRDTGVSVRSDTLSRQGKTWTADTLRPWVEHVIGCFGWDRVVWGSDWPVCTLGGGLLHWVAATFALTQVRRNATGLKA